MKINKTKEIEAFLDRCRFNIMNDSKSEFVGMHVTKADEKAIQRELADAGFAEFNTDEKNWPSLFLSRKEWENSPYHANVSMDLIKDSHFSYETIKTAGRELFNADVIQKDPNRELNDWMKLRAMDSNFDAIYLYQDENDWMMDAPSEAATNNVPASHAHGNIVTFGLGIGYFIYMAMQNPAVTSITVVESSPEVITMFERFLLPQFPGNIPLNIIHGNAYDYFNEEFLSKFDYSYTDIWFSSDDGLQIIEKLLENYLPNFETTDFWIEDSCLEIMWTLTFLYFDAIYHKQTPACNPYYEKEMQKICRYYDNLDLEVAEVNTLKHYIYDTKTIREILSQKI